MIIGGTILMPVQMEAQGPIITYQFPNGFPNVAVNVNCIFSSNFDIDTNHVVQTIYDYPDMEWDSISNTLNYAIAYFIESGSYVSTDSSLINAVVNNGVPAIFEPTSLRNFKVIPFRELKNNQSYDILIKYLPVFNGIQWVTVDTIFQNALSTIGEMYRIEANSVLFNNSYVKCTDSIFVTFNRKLSNATINMQDILTLHKVTGTTPIDSLHHTTSTEEVETSCYLSNDSMTVFLNADELEAGVLYNLQVHLNLLTGNPNDNTSVGFSVGNLAVLTSGVKHTDGETELPENLLTSFYGQEFYVAEGNEITLTTPISCENYIFKHWQCETLPNINNSTELLLNIEVDCSMSGKHEIIAVYDDALIDTLTLSDSLFIGGDIVVEGFIDSLGNGQYTFMRQIGKIISIIPIADSGYSFNGWKFDTLLFADLEIVGNTVQIPTNNAGMSIMGDINDPNGRNIDLGGGWGTLATCTTVDFCFHFWGLSGIPGSVVPNINSIVDVFINGLPYELNSTESTTNGYVCITLPYPFEVSTLEFAFEFKDNCFSLLQKRFGEKGFIPEFTQNGDGFVFDMNLTQAYDYRDANCKVFLDITLKRKSFILEVDRALIGDANFIYPGAPFEIKVYNTVTESYKKPRFGSGYPKTWKDEHSSYLFDFWKIQEVYDCDCGEELDIYPLIKESGYEYGYWSEPIPEDPDDDDLTYAPVFNPKEVDGANRNDVLEVLMDYNHHVQYRFDANFQITKFSFWLPKVINNNVIESNEVEKIIYLDNLKTSSDIPVDLYQTAAMNFSGLGEYEYLEPENIPQTTQIYFHFNKQIDRNSIDDETFNCVDFGTALPNGQRYDGKQQTKYIFNPSITPSNSEYTNGDRTIMLQLSDNRNVNNIQDIPHMSNFSVNLNFENIRSINNEPLTYKSFTKIGFLMSTELPAMVVKSKKVSLFFKCPFDPGMTFDAMFYSHVWASLGYQNYIIDLSSLSKINSEGGTQYPLPDNYSTIYFKCNQTKTMWEQERLLFYVNRLNSNDMFAAGFELTQTFENSEAYNKFNELSIGMGDTLLNIVAPEWKLGQLLMDFIKSWITLGWWDDIWFREDVIITMGDLSEPKTMSSLWGTGQLYKPKTILIDKGFGIVELEVTIISQ